MASPKRNGVLRDGTDAARSRAILQRILTDAERLEAELRGLVRRRAVSSKSVHALHRDLRQWREDFRLARAVLGSDAAVPGAALRSDLAAFRRRVRAVRDRDVAAILAGDAWLWKRSRRPERRRSVVRRLRAAAQRERHQLGRDAHVPVLLAELDGYCSALRSTVARDAARLPAAARDEFASARRRGRRTLRRLRKRPTVHRLHRHRVELRRLRDLRRTIDGDDSDLEASGQSLRPWIRRLGRLHDLAVLESALHDARGGTRAAARSVRRRRRAMKDRLVRSLEASPRVAT